MTLVLWRHGQTDYNLEGRIQGRVDIPLNDIGRDQAASAAPDLVALNPAAIFSSPLERARQTAEVLASAIGLGVHVDNRLAERSFGRWEGLSRAQIEERWPEQFDVWRSGGDPGGVGVETRSDAALRVGTAMREIAAAAGGTAVVVAHGAAITLGTTHLLGLDSSSWFGLHGLGNCRYAVLNSMNRPPEWRISRWNGGGEGDSGDVGAHGGHLS